MHVCVKESWRFDLFPDEFRTPPSAILPTHRHAPHRDPPGFYDDGAVVCAGDRVRLHSLSMDEFNGSIGQVQGKADGRPGRWRVMLNDGRDLAIRPINLSLVATASNAAVDDSAASSTDPNISCMSTCMYVNIYVCKHACM